MRICIKYIMVITFIISLVGCGAKKEYTTEDMELPEIFQLPDSISQIPDSVLISRKKLFKDSALSRLIENAFKNNFDLRLANKDIAINDQYYKESKVAFFPTLNLNVLNIEREWSSKNGSSSPESGWYEHRGTEAPENGFISSSSFSSSAIMNWEIDIWGKLRNQKLGAQALYQQSYVARKVIQTELVATVAEDYYTLLRLDEQLEVAKKNHKFRDSTLRMIKLLYKAGEVSALAVQQSEIQVLEASALMSQLEETREIQENNLRLLVGELPGIVDRGTSSSMDNLPYGEVRTLPLYLVQNRPDVQVSLYGLTAANARVGVTQAQRLPNLTISAEGGLESLLPQNWFNIPGSLFGSIIGGLTAPIFNGRKLTTEFEVAKLERDKAEINFQRNVYRAIVDVRNTLVSLKRLEDQLDIAIKKQDVAQNALKSSRMLFQSGFADYLEVIRAQGEALDTELNLVTTKTNLLTARIHLYRALGGGWELDEH